MPADSEFAQLVALARLIRGRRDLSVIHASLRSRPRQQLFIKYLMGQQVPKSDTGRFRAVVDFAYA